MEENLLLNHTYLLKYNNSLILSPVLILKITNTAYQLHWNQSGNITWEEKTKIHYNYTVVEDISDFVQDVNAEKCHLNL